MASSSDTEDQADGVSHLAVNQAPSGTVGATPTASTLNRLTPRQARVLAWQTGFLEYLFRERPGQVEVYQKIRSAWEAGLQTYALLIHRQWGKSRMLCAIGLEECLRVPNTNAVYLTDTKTHAEQIVLPLINQLLEDCPKHLRPVYKRERRAYEFHNGSTLTIYGVDFDGLDKGRGVRSRVLLIDEAGFQDQIKEALAVYLPILSTTNGFCLIATTPPSTPGHPFVEVFAKLRDAGYTSVVPLDENPDATAAMRRSADQYRDLLGEAAYRREWQCDMSGVGDDTVVVPEWPAVRASAVQEVTDLPARADHYIGYDIGGRDWDAFCFGSWDHVKGRFVVQDELFLRQVSIADMAAAVKATIERLRWDKDGGRLMMFADHNNAHLLNEFRRTYDLNFLPTKKPEKVAQVHEVRQLLSDKELVIDPRCIVLQRTLERAQWDRTHKGFVRTEQADLEKRGMKPIGHADMLDALVYSVVNVRRHLTHDAPPKQTRDTVRDRYPSDRPGAAGQPRVLKGSRPVSQQAKDMARALHGMLTGKGPTGR